MASLEITRLTIPKRVPVGDSATLECDWISNSKRIYSLKWYLGLKEFYRWTPADKNPVQVSSVVSERVFGAVYNLKLMHA